MPFFMQKKADSSEVPAVITMGMHISGGEKTKPVYFILRSLIAAAGIFGTVLCFITATSGEGFHHFPAGKLVVAMLAGWAYFSAVFAVYERRPELSRNLSCTGIILLMLYGIIRMPYISTGIMNAVNMFMGSLYAKYRDIPIFLVPKLVEGSGGDSVEIGACTDEAFIFLVLLICAVVCRGTVKRPNILLVIGATFPLAELCLYFGLVPNYSAYALLLCAWSGALAAEITEFGAFADKSAGGLFTKTSAQSALAAALIMMMAFTGAIVYSSDFTRPQRADSFRTGFMQYMKDFSWKKLSEDLKDAFLPAESRSVTHDGKLGNVESIEFSGQNMLEVTLPEDSGTLYLKGFTGTEYTGSRWNEGPPAPPLDTKLTSPEFFSGRTLKYVPEYNSLISRDVIVRNTGISSSVKYYPVNSAGLLETGSSRRTYGVYFPPDDDWRRHIIEAAEDMQLPETLGSDEQRLRAYAEKYCLDIPATFTAAEEFFSDYEGTTLYEELVFIREKLSEECEYNLDAGKKPFGADFVQWFLTDNHRGSCTHFASAAVLLCRSRGIPARYCEGFIVKNEDIGDFPAENGYVTVSVPDTRAHAWAEVYIEGYGWLSYEATPGYGNVSLEYASGSESEVSSVITSVTTEAPVFSESVSSETTVTFTATATEENTVRTEESREYSSEMTSNITTAVPDSSGETEDSFDFSSVTQNDTESVTTLASDGAQTDAASSLNDESAQTSETDTVYPDSREPDPEILGIILKILEAAGIIAAAAGIIILRRHTVFALRRRRIGKAPDRAAAEIYRMLIRLAEKAEIDMNVPADELAARMGEHVPFDQELCGSIISAALKARFGGGISSEEAKCSAEAYKKIYISLNENSNGERLSSMYVYCSDKYV